MELVANVNHCVITFIDHISISQIGKKVFYFSKNSICDRICFSHKSFTCCFMKEQKKKFKEKKHGHIRHVKVHNMHRKSRQKRLNWNMYVWCVFNPKHRSLWKTFGCFWKGLHLNSFRLPTICLNGSWIIFKSKIIECFHFIWNLESSNNIQTQTKSRKFEIDDFFSFFVLGSNCLGWKKEE